MYDTHTYTYIYIYVYIYIQISIFLSSTFPACIHQGNLTPCLRNSQKMKKSITPMYIHPPFTICIVNLFNGTCQKHTPWWFQPTSEIANSTASRKTAPKRLHEPLKIKLARDPKQRKERVHTGTTLWTWWHSRFDMKGNRSEFNTSNYVKQKTR